MRLRTSSQQHQQKKLDSTETEVQPKIESDNQNVDSQTSSQKSGICYCGGTRILGGLEVQCSDCKRWFHQACFQDLDNFGGLPFMVAYNFICKNCSADSREKWNIRSTTFSSMAVMALANMTLEYRKGNISSATSCEQNNPYFHIEREIVPYVEKNWEYLSTTPRRQKRTWHHTILKTLQKDTDLFEQSQTDENAFSLKEKDLFRIGPMHESVIQIFKRGRDAAEREANALQIGEQISSMVHDGQFIEGPKTRGASKRKAAAVTVAANGSDFVSKASSGGSDSQKKPKITAEFATVHIEGKPGTAIDFPFNREGYRYYLVEKEPTISNRGRFDNEEVNNTRAVQIPSHIYRLVISSVVTLSPNDRANQLHLEGDNLTVLGFEGYSTIRATHSVSHGNWYFEMEFLNQPTDSHVRIGWAQSYAVLQSCVGYSKFTYGIRSKKGTAFHDGRGHHYKEKGFGQGDIVGCLISLPSIEEQKDILPISEVLPPSKKDCDLIRFKQTCFFEEKEEPQLALQRLRPLKGSKIEFFINGQTCGTAFEDIYAGHYFPAVSIFQGARVRFNFGPKFLMAPNVIENSHVKPMSARAEEQFVEQELADILYMITNEQELENKNAEYFNAILSNENSQ